MRTVRELMALRGRTALISGGAGHIGSAMGEALAELGAEVAVLDMAPERCIAVADRLSNTYEVKTLPLPIDLTDEAAVRSVAESILDHFGRLDVLVNCAALVFSAKVEGWTGPFLEQTSDAWRTALEINLTVPFILTQSCAPALATSGHGSVVNISSIYGMVGPDMRLYEGIPMGNAAAYGASKGGLLQLTRWLATTLAPEVRVNAITAGGVWRSQPDAFHERYVARTPLQRMATEEDLKGAVAYLASDLSNYVTGHNLVVDGGWIAW